MANTQQPQQPLEIRDVITLNETESALLGTLLDAVRSAGTGTVLRCAGGWVRDKLLGRESLDIDVALDNVMGREFAATVNLHLQAQGKDTHSAAVIQSNPDQSKHLETARMKIYDIWIDLVNLRSETYASDSRIPTMEFGTPEQDALRRDFTINSMFYNINLGVVEDLTGRGMQDLRAGIIRTPLHPMETFLDDPLRVLRAVRFATRFGFELEESLVQAASSEKVRLALGEKVSKERVGTELEGMVNGPAPVAAVRLLSRLNLFSTVFALPPEQRKQLPPPSLYSGACGNCMEAADALAGSLGLVLDKEERRFLLLAALLLPMRELQVAGPKGKQVPATTHVIRESIKWRAKDAEMTVALHEAALELHRLHQELSASDPPSSSTVPDAAAADGVKVALGNVIRKLKQHWKLGVCLAAVLSMPSSTPLGAEASRPSSAPGPPPAAAAAAAAGHRPGSPGSPSTPGPGREELGEDAGRQRLELARVLLSGVAAFGLEDCWQWKPLLDGKQIMSLLGMSKPGPELGRVLADVTEWQLVHPAGSLEQCRDFISTKWAKKC